MSSLEKAHVIYQLLILTLVFGLLVHAAADQLIGIKAILIVVTGLAANIIPLALINNLMSKIIHAESPDNTHLYKMLPFWLVIMAGTCIYLGAVFFFSGNPGLELFGLVPLTEAVAVTLLALKKN